MFLRTHLPRAGGRAAPAKVKTALRRRGRSAPTRPWLSRHELSAAEGAAFSSDQNRIPRSSESRVICIDFQILVQSRILAVEIGMGCGGTPARPEPCAQR